MTKEQAEKAFNSEVEYLKYKLIQLFECMPEEKRLEFLYDLDFCFDCGTKGRYCHCTNDE